MILGTGNFQKYSIGWETTSPILDALMMKQVLQRNTEYQSKPKEIIKMMEDISANLGTERAHNR